MKPIRWLAIPIICAALLAGCETARVAPAPPPVSVDLAEKAERSGDFLIAAQAPGTGITVRPACRADRTR